MRVNEESSKKRTRLVIEIEFPKFPDVYFFTLIIRVRFFTRNGDYEVGWNSAMKFKVNKSLFNRGNHRYVKRGAFKVRVGATILFMVMVTLCGCNAKVKPSVPTSNMNFTSSPPTMTTPNSYSLVIPSPTGYLNNPFSTPGKVETALYTHPGNLFTLQAPMDWTVNETLFDASFSDHKGDVLITVKTINTGYALNDDTFLRLIDNRETTNASILESYIEVDWQILSPSSISIKNTFIDGGKVKAAASIYGYQRNAVLIVDFWANETSFSAYQPLFETVYASVEINGEAVESLPVYSFASTRLHTNGYFSIMISPYWSMRRVENNVSTVETFTSPDEHAIIQTLVYADGKPITMKIAGELALALLQNNYPTDIIVTKDEVLKDGREILTWGSSESNYQGIITFTRHGNTAQILSVLWDQDPDGYYEAILNQVLLSYTQDE